MEKIGFLGLGSMGHGMALNLTKKCGKTVLGYDPVDSLRQSFEDDGGVAVNSADEIFRQCQCIILSLPTNEAVIDTVHAVAEKAQKGTTIIDMGSTNPVVIQELYRFAQSEGMYLLDAPVSGASIKADDGTLVIMCGGDREVFDNVRPLLLTMGSNVTFMGKSGMGSTAKLANNMMVHIHLMAIGEAFTFAKKAGIDSRLLFEAIRDGFAQSTAMDVRVPVILERDFTPTAKLKVAMKDIANALDLADNIGIDVPLTGLVMDSMNWAEEQGLLDEDHCALVKYYEQMTGVEIK